MRSIILSEVKEYIFKGFGCVGREKHTLFKNSELEFTTLYAEGPYEDFVSYSTIGLSKVILNGSEGPLPFGIEIISGTPLGVKDFSRVLVVAHKFFIEEQLFIGPGNVLQDAVKQAGISLDHLPHLYFSMPVYWGEHFSGITSNGVNIKFLCVFPISENEYAFLKKNGMDRFEDLMIENEVDIFNPKRESCL